MCFNALINLIFMTEFHSFSYHLNIAKLEIFVHSAKPFKDFLLEYSLHVVVDVLSSLSVFIHLSFMSSLLWECWHASSLMVCIYVFISLSSNSQVSLEIPLKLWNFSCFLIDYCFVLLLC